MSSLSQDLFFAAVGDVHGDMYAMLRLLQSWESRFRKQLAFVLQVGDFEPHRNAADVATMDAPNKYKKLGNFPNFYSGKSIFPWPIWFIGGNHEPYGFLDQKPEGFEVAKNCHYLGRVGSVVLGKLKIVGVSGIYREDLYYRKRPDVSQIGSRSNKDYIGFTQDEIAQAIDLKSADILLLHEWPRGVISPVDMAEFQQWRCSLGYDDEVGNDYARMLVEFLKPKLVLCGHMHKRYRNQVSFSPGVVTDICCLANVAQGWDASIAIFQITPDGNLFEVSEGLALCYPTTDII